MHSAIGWPDDIVVERYWLYTAYSMNKDFRRNVLATITQLLKKIAHLKHLENLELR